MNDIWDQATHHYADNNGVKIHYVTHGAGEPVVFVHGFPDFWYSWRHQMATLAPYFKVVGVDMRAYNQSDKPQGLDNYRMEHLLEDLRAVIRDLNADKVSLVAHDWGGAIAWRFAMSSPDLVERLIILNLTHPKGYAAVVADPTPEQKENVQYARNFSSSKPEGNPVPENVLTLGERSGDALVGQRYREALGNSYWDGMMNYYRANYGALADPEGDAIPDITCPVLQFHGLLDTAVDKGGLNNTWNWVTEDYTLVTAPGAGHFVHWEAAELVSATMKWWLLART